MRKRANLKSLFIGLFGKELGNTYYNHFYNYGGRVKDIIHIEINDELRFFMNDDSIRCFGSLN